MDQNFTEQQQYTIDRLGYAGYEVVNVEEDGTAVIVLNLALAQRWAKGKTVRPSTQRVTTEGYLLR